MPATQVGPHTYAPQQAREAPKAAMTPQAALLAYPSPVPVMPSHPDGSNLVLVAVSQPILPFVNGLCTAYQQMQNGTWPTQKAARKDNRQK